MDWKWLKSPSFQNIKPTQETMITARNPLHGSCIGLYNALSKKLIYWKLHFKTTKPLVRSTVSFTNYRTLPDIEKFLSCRVPLMTHFTSHIKKYNFPDFCGVNSRDQNSHQVLDSHHKTIFQLMIPSTSRRLACITS